MYVGFIAEKTFASCTLEDGILEANKFPYLLLLLASLSHGGKQVDIGAEYYLLALHVPRVRHQRLGQRRCGRYQGRVRQVIWSSNFN